MNWCEIFKTGKHKDSKGAEREWGLMELQEMKRNFEERNPDVPVCCGHPKSNSPAYGWFDALKVEPNKENGFSLFAKFKNVQEDFKEAVNKGLYKMRSISITPDLMIRHLAFLGAQTPAVKRLEEFCFQADENAAEIEFELNEPQSGHLLFEDNNPDGAGNSPFLNPKNKEGVEKVNEEEFQKQLSAKNDEIAVLKKQLNEAEKAKQMQEFEDFCSNAIAAGQLLPAQKDAVIDILTASADYEPYEFEDGQKKTVCAMVKDLIGSMKQFDFKETASKSKAGEGSDNIDFSDSDAILQAITEKQEEFKAKGITLSPIEALKKVKAQD